MTRPPGPARRVLVVARWYPAHDDPGRGSFVADQVELLRAHGIEVVVASFEAAFVRGLPSDRDRVRAAAAAAWAAAVASRAALNVPRTWGGGVPVARLPVVLEPGRRAALELLAAHSGPLVAFGEALAARWPVDLVHAHTGVPDGLAAADLAERLGVPLLVTEHDSTSPRTLGDDPAAAAAYRSLLVGRSAVVAVSHALADRLTTALRVSSDAIGELPNHVPVGRFPLGRPVERDPDLLLWVGARRQSKGMETLLRAFARARARRPALRLRCIGRSDDAATEAGWLTLAATLGIADAVQFDPPAARSEVATAMRRASIFVHPSPWETFGMVAAEALASGLPVAATPSGGVPEIVGLDGACGEIADGPDDVALAAAIERLLDRRTAIDPGLLRRRVEERYGPAIVAERLAERYAAALAAPHGDAAPTSWGFEAAAPLSTPPSTPAPLDAVPMGTLPLVVAGHRSSARRRLAMLPPDLARALTVLTVAEDRVPAESIPGTVVELDPERAYREGLAAIAGTATGGPLGRVAALLSKPLRMVRRRRLFRRRTDMRLTALAAGVEATWRSASAEHAEGREPPGLLCLDAADVVASARAIEAGARLEPGALRWLADRWDAAGRDPVSSGDLAAGRHGSRRPDDN